MEVLTRRLQLQSKVCCKVNVYLILFCRPQRQSDVLLPVKTSKTHCCHRAESNEHLLQFSFLLLKLYRPSK